MIKDFWYRTLAYLKALFTEDPHEKVVLELVLKLEKAYEKRLADNELIITYLRQKLEDKDEAFNKLQTEFISYAVKEHEVVPEIVLPKPALSNSWTAKRNRLEEVSRRKVEEKINNVEEDLFGPGTADAFSYGKRTDANVDNSVEVSS